MISFMLLSRSKTLSGLIQTDAGQKAMQKKNFCSVGCQWKIWIKIKIYKGMPMLKRRRDLNLGKQLKAAS